MKLILASEFPCSLLKTEGLLGDVRGKKAVFIPTAAYGEAFEPSYEEYIKPLEDMGMQVDSFDLREKREEEVAVALSEAAVISVCGGNTFFLLGHMNKSGFRKVIKERLDAGVVYIGSSAGSIVCSPDIEFISTMDDPSKASLESTKGLNLINSLFMPHLDRMEPARQQILLDHKGDTPIIALRDDQLFYVEGDKVEII